MKKFENPSLPAPIYIYADIFYTPCLPYRYFRLENIDDLKARLKIDDDLIAHIVSAYHKNKDLFPNEGNELITDLKNHKLNYIDTNGQLCCASVNDNIHLTLLAYGNQNQDTLQNIAKLEIKTINLVLAERDDLPTDVVITLLCKNDVEINASLLKNGRYNDDETLLSAINTGLEPVIKAIAEKEDISIPVFNAFKRFYHYNSVLVKLTKNKKLPEHMLADIILLENLPIAGLAYAHTNYQYTQYMNEYHIFEDVDINSDNFVRRIKAFYSSSYFILPKNYINVNNNEKI